MCRWHKMAAKLAATDPVTEDFHVGKFAIALVALGQHRVEQDRWGLKGVYEIDGFNPAEILTEDAIEAFDNSSVPKHLSKEDLSEMLNVLTSKLRHALDETAKVFDLSSEALNISDIITVDGYKSSCCAQANPRENGPFLDTAIVCLVKGYDTHSLEYASGPLELISFEEREALQDNEFIPDDYKKNLKMLEPLRSSIEYFLELGGSQSLLEETFSTSVSYIFATAENDFQLGLGLSGKSECVMCEGAKPTAPEVY